MARISLADSVLSKTKFSILISKPFCLKLKIKHHKTFKKPLLYKSVKFYQIRTGRKFIYRHNTSVIACTKRRLTLLQTFKFVKQTCNV